MRLVIGARSDPHVAAVLALLDDDVSVLDAESFTIEPLTLTRHGLRTAAGYAARGQGWIRRLSPEGWLSSLSDGTLAGVKRAAAVAALAAVVRDERVSWLTPIDRLGASENKPYQYRLAERAGVPVPAWLVTTDPGQVPTEGSWVAKPLGPGSFIDDQGSDRVVPTTPFDQARRGGVAAAPFVLQRQVKPAAHARVVTVGDHAFSATLPADGLPLDWRLQPAAHTAFSANPVPDHVELMALAAASALRVGFSSQDWILDRTGSWWFVDLNPAGQWLFLPAEVADQVTRRVATFLDAEPS
jgi:hypothetical protein